MFDFLKFDQFKILKTLYEVVANLSHIVADPMLSTRQLLYLVLVEPVLSFETH